MNELFGLETWQAYVIIAVCLMIAEIFVPSLILLPIGIGVLISAAFAPFIESNAILYLVTAAWVGVVFVVFKRVFDPKDSPRLDTAVDAMIGKQVIVTKKVSASHAGEVKLYGDIWNALSAENDVEFEENESAVISKVEGNKVFLTKNS